MEKILILMSTYNGENYLEEQLDSIFNQKDVIVDVLVRDDGSNDKTQNILEEYSKKHSLKWYTGENLKSAKSFLNLIYNCDDDYNYYALADQDDVWKDNKISTAVTKIAEYSNQPCMYFSDKEIVNQNLEIIDEKCYKYKNTFECSMIRNIATGCTIVFDNKLLKKIREYQTFNINCMHDSWIYRVCLAINGIAIYDNEKNIMYRQHGNNVLGANESIVNKLKRRWNSLLHCPHYRKKCAIELLNGYSSYMTEDKKLYLENFANYQKSIKSKLKLIFGNNKTENLKQNIIFIICVLINRI